LYDYTPSWQEKKLTYENDFSRLMKTTSLSLPEANHVPRVLNPLCLLELVCVAPKNTQ
jgi:hypothetical protein